MSKWDALKEAKGLLTAIISTAGVCIIIGGAVMEWRIGVNVTKALSAVDLATDIKIIDMDKATATNTSGVAENKEDIGGLDRRTEMAFAALMGRQVPDND